MSLRSPSPPPSERTPLLDRPDEDGPLVQPAAAANEPQAQDIAKRPRRRWPTIVALVTLSLAVVVALCGFALPSVVEEYAKEGVVFEPTKLSIDSFTALGIRARIKGTFYMDAARVQHRATRELGRLGTWFAREVQTGKAHVDVYLADYGDLLLGTATLPPVKVNVRNQHRNTIDVLADVQPGDVDGLRQVAQDFLKHKLTALTVHAVAELPIRSGLLKLGRQTISQTLALRGDDVPAVPKFEIQQLRFAEWGLPGHPDGVKAMATVSAMNDFPLRFDVPPLAFEVMLPDCADEFAVLGTAHTEVVHIVPQQNVTAAVTGLVRQLPNTVTSECPGTGTSPLDGLLGDYLAGKNATVYIRGGEQGEDTPDWIGKILGDTTVPFTLPGHPFDSLIKNFTLEDVHFSLPDPLTDAPPTVSALVKVLVKLPPEMNVNLDVDRVRANAYVFYKGDLLGKLDLRRWQPANASQVDGDLLVQSVVDDAPLEIQDDTVFSQVVQQLLFGHGAELSVHAEVDVNTLTALGEFVVRRIPADGTIFVKPLTGGFQVPKIKGMEVVETSQTSLTLRARVNVINPTDYSASVPHANLSVSVNGTRVGYAWASAARIVPGPNEVVGHVAWNVGDAGREWLSQYLSGYNTTLTVQTHAHSVPGLPDPHLKLTVPAPHMLGHFIKEATMHVFSSTATFVLVSPLALFVTNISAAAFYNDTQVGTIEWEYPFQILPGENETPRLPVQWGSDAVGTIRDALGGTLKLDAKAEVGVRIGHWQEQVWYEGRGLGAKIRLWCVCLLLATHWPSL